MKGINITLLNNQRGAATLVTSLILLLAITLVTFSAARVGVIEQRTSTNDMRAKTAQDVANAGVDYGIAYLNKNHGLINVVGSNGWGPGGSSGATWQPCTNQTALPCGDGATNIYNAAGPGFTNWLYSTVPTGKLAQPSGAYSYTVNYLSPCANNPCTGNNIIPVQDSTVVVIAQATNANDPLAARAISQRVVRSASGLGRIPQAPIVAAGTVDLSGTMDIWGNATGILVATVGTANPATTTAAATGVSDSTISYTFPPPPPLPLVLPPAPTYQRASTLTATTGLNTITTVTTGTPLSVWTPNTATLVSNGTMTCVPFYPSSHNVISGIGGLGSACGGHGTQDTGVVSGQDFITPATTPITHPAERVSAYLADGTPCYEPFPGNTLTTPNPTGCPNYARDLFEYIFGVLSVRADEIKNQSTLISDCNTIHNLPAARYWVVGNCTIRNVVVGTVAKPFVVIVEGDLDVGSSNTEFYGLIYVRGAGRSARMNGGLFQGALVSESPVTRANGNHSMVYDAQVLLRASTNTGTFRPTSGGWADEM
jgi:hypothetical protein